VLDYLRGLDDFATARTIAQAVGALAQGKHVFSALNELRTYKCVDCMQQNGHLWWYALPPEMDTRQKVIHERTPEEKPRAAKKWTCTQNPNKAQGHVVGTNGQCAWCAKQVYKVKT